VTPFVADTSAWWRAATLPNELGSLLKRAVLDDRFWITPIVRMEVLYSARTSSEYAELEQELDALRILRNDRAVADAATNAIRELAARADGYHRVARGAIRVLVEVCGFDRSAIAWTDKLAGGGLLVQADKEPPVEWLDEATGS
jgi:predicted nucleic acid-binding protein